MFDSADGSYNNGSKPKNVGSCVVDVDKSFFLDFNDLGKFIYDSCFDRNPGDTSKFINKDFINKDISDYFYEVGDASDAKMLFINYVSSIKHDPEAHGLPEVFTPEGFAAYDLMHALSNHFIPMGSFKELNECLVDPEFQSLLFRREGHYSKGECLEKIALSKNLNDYV